MTDGNQQRDVSGIVEISRRAMLGAVGGSGELAALTGASRARLVDDRGGGEQMTHVELARARVERYSLGRIEEKTGCCSSTFGRWRPSPSTLSSRHPRDGRGLDGLRRRRRPAGVRSILGQPHIWEQVLLYVATLEAYPPEGRAFDGGSIGGVLEALRRAQRPE
jgi:hypothetical protein